MSVDLVSVIIPTCNRSELCLRAVNSAFAQTYPEIEVIVIIDGPDEITKQSLQQLADPRLKVIELPSRVGGSSTRNRGIEECRGRWIAFLDDDDEWFPRKLELQVAAIKQAADPDNTILSSQLICQFDKSSWLLPMATYDNRNPVCEFLFCRETFSDYRVIQTSTLLLSRKLAAQISFVPGLKKHQDLDFILRAKALHNSEIQIIPEPLAIWHHDHGNGHVGKIRDWKFSFNWMESNPQLFTATSRIAFFLTVVVPPITSLPFIVSFVRKHQKGARVRLIWYSLLMREWAKAGVRRICSSF